MDELLAAAARNNADWCDLVCRANGMEPQLTPGLWWSPTRTPPLYPDAVTLLPQTTATQVLDRIDASPGASVKDSFSKLDLGAAGFQILFSADWIVATGSGAQRTPSQRWKRVQDVADWARWQAVGPELPDIPAVLFAQERVTLLWADDEPDTGARAVLHASGDVVGISNAAAVDGPSEAMWSDLVVEAAARYPGRAIVGYERHEELAAALACGFLRHGPLRVWTRHGEGEP